MPTNNTAPVLADTIAKRYVAHAIPRPEGGFYAVWAAPGMTQGYVMFEDGPEVFTEEWAAEAKAKDVLFDALNRRSLPTSAIRPNVRGRIENVSFQKMTAAEFAVALREADISATEFAYLWGTRPEKVQNMLRGSDNVPFPVRWVLHLLRNDANYEAAMDIVDENTIDKPSNAGGAQVTAGR